MSLLVNGEVDIKTFPSVEVTTLNGKKVNISDYVANDKPTIISFWATWCAPCKRELDTITEYYPEWQEKIWRRITSHYH